MRILVDFTQIPIQRAGAGIYAENLVRSLLPIVPPDHQLFLLLQSDEVAMRAELEATEGVRVISIPHRLFRNRIALMFFEQIILPFILLNFRIDVLHSLHYTLPFWSSAARVVTFHDMTIVLWPQLHTRARRIIMPIYMRLAWKMADAVLFVSAATQKDTERILPPSATWRAVTPLGVATDAFRIHSSAEVQAALDEVEIRQPYLLFIGTIEPRKNIVRIIEAFEKIADRHPDCTLVLAGKFGWDYEPAARAMVQSSHAARIRHLGYISDRTKRILIAGCAALVYPSLYEGFGLPVLEGMAAGVPVITSNVSSLPEVSGDAAILVNPESINEVAEAMEQVLGSGIGDTLRKRGPWRAKQFTWERTAAETLKAYLMVSQRRNNVQDKNRAKL